MPETAYALNLPEDWTAIERALDEHGHAPLPGLLDTEAARRLGECLDKPPRERLETISLGRGKGVRADLSHGQWDALHAPLASIANRWCQAFGQPNLHAPNGQVHCAHLTHLGADDFMPLLPGVDDPELLPVRLLVLLSDPQDFSGGELVLTEQRPRMQSRLWVVPLSRGDGVLLCSQRRPLRNSQGQLYGAQLRHGIGRVRSGVRVGLEVSFQGRHDN